MIWVFKINHIFLLKTALENKELFNTCIYISVVLKCVIILIYQMSHSFVLTLGVIDLKHFIFTKKVQYIFVYTYTCIYYIILKTNVGTHIR